MLAELLYLWLLGCVSSVIVLLVHAIGAVAPIAVQIGACWFMLWVSIDIMFVQRSSIQTVLMDVNRRMNKIESGMHTIRLALTQSNTF